MTSACRSGSAASAGSVAASRSRTASSLPGLRPANAQRQPSGTCPGEVLGGQPAGEAGGAEQDDVELAVGHVISSSLVKPSLCQGNRPVAACVRPQRDRPRGHCDGDLGDGDGQQTASRAPRSRSGRRPARRSARCSAPGCCATGAVLVGSAARLVRLPVRGGRRAARLRRLRGAAAVVRRRPALPQVGPWGLGGPVMILAERADAGPRGATRPASPRQARSGAVGSSGTGTNVQEAGVDEPDLAKTDGRSSSGSRAGSWSSPTCPAAARASCPGRRCPGRGCGAPSCCCATTGWSWSATSSTPTGPGAAGRCSDRIVPAGAPRPARAHLVRSTSATRRRRGSTDDQTFDGGAVSDAGVRRRHRPGGRHHRAPRARLRATPTGTAPGARRPGCNRPARPRSAPIERWLPGVRVAPAATPTAARWTAPTVRHPAARPRGSGRSAC